MATGPVLYYWPGSAPCRAVLMALKGGNIHVDKVIVDRLKDKHKEQDFLQISPEGRLPTLVDGEERISHSLDILKHLMTKYGHKKSRLYPKDSDIRTRVNAMLEYDSEDVYPAVSSWVFPQVFEKFDPDNNKEAIFQKCLNHLDRILDDQSFLVTSHVTVADLAVAATLSLLELRDYDVSQWKHLSRWLATTRDLPYYSECNKGFEEWKFAVHFREHGD